MSAENTSSHKDASQDEMNALFCSQVEALYTGVQSFTPHLETLHREFENETFPDWPTVLLSTIQQTTVVSLYKLLPPAKACNEPVDRRSIASLIRNMVDTYDSLDFLCNPSTEHESALHRDILGYYLAGRTHTLRKQLSADEAGTTYDEIRSNYWTKIDRAIRDKPKKNRLRRGQNLFYSTRRERLETACGDHANFIGAILTELSTYVHSVPPALWMASLDDGFLDTPKTRGVLAVWLQIANFYYASSIRVVSKSFAFKPKGRLATYLEQFEHVFSS